ncbi:hypothetical protein E4U52_003578 [Claviceps spartinae]|nr:hypothetical protein E4U52_003578 [Claviceps spartinae]
MGPGWKEWLEEGRAFDNEKVSILMDLDDCEWLSLAELGLCQWKLLLCRRVWALAITLQLYNLLANERMEMTIVTTYLIGIVRGSSVRMLDAVMSNVENLWRNPKLKLRGTAGPSLRIEVFDLLIQFPDMFRSKLEI